MNHYLSLLKNKKTKHLHLNHKIAQSAILVALLFVISYFSLFITKFIGLPHGIDCSYFLMIAALYIVGYKFSLLISIAHSLLIFMISGNWIGGLANMIQAIVLITTWWVITNGFFRTYNSAKKYQWWSILKLGITIISVSLICASLMTIANLYIFFPLLGFANLLHQPIILWIHFIANNIVNILNIILFLMLMPLINRITKQGQGQS